MTENIGDKIEIGDEQYISGITEKGEQYLLKFDNGSQKEIKIVFSNNDSDDIPNMIMQTLSYQYIKRALIP